MAPLSQKDKLILGALFDSESSPKNIIPIDSEETNTNSLPGISQETLNILQSREKNAILSLNSESPPKETITEAISSLTTLINEYPTYASAYNNRAQALRLLLGDDLTSPDAAQSTLYPDLTTACTLAAPESKAATVSQLQAKILASAHTHKAHLLLKVSKLVNEAPEKGQNLPRELRGKDREALERLAGREFQLGGMYGNPIARQMAVQLNPYAKMCGEIVKEAMRNDIKEYYQNTAVGMSGVV